MKRFNEKLAKELGIKFLVTSLMFLLAVGIFIFLAHEVVLENEDLFDSKVFNFLQPYTTPAVTNAMKVITFFGTTYFFLPAYTILVIYLWIRKSRSDAVDIAIIGLSSTFLMFGLKRFFHRQRPPLPLLKTLHTFSFPSGHSLCSFIFCSVLAYLVWKTNWTNLLKYLASFLLLAASLSVGLSRIILHYHYASDVLAGFCLGIAWVLMSLWVQKKIRKKINPKIENA